MNEYIVKNQWTKNYHWDLYVLESNGVALKRTKSGEIFQPGQGGNVKLSFGLLSEIQLSASLNHFTGEEAKRSRAFEFRSSSRQ
jgi:hypothetical protein